MALLVDVDGTPRPRRRFLGVMRRLHAAPVPDGALPDLESQRILAWAFVKAVLSEVWSAEDGGEVGSRALDVAPALSPRL